MATEQTDDAATGAWWTPRHACILYVSLEVLAVGIGVWLVSQAVGILADIAAGRDSIVFDSGDHNAALLLALPWMHLCGSLHKRGRISLKRFEQLNVGFFLALIVAAWGSAQWLHARFEGAGYEVCPGPRQHRITAGREYVYARGLDRCPAAE